MSCFFFFYFQHVQNFINQTWSERYQSDISEDVLTLIWSVIVSSFTLGGFVGVTIGGTLSVKLGRYGRIDIDGETNQFLSLYMLFERHFMFSFPGKGRCWLITYLHWRLLCWWVWVIQQGYLNYSSLDGFLLEWMQVNNLETNKCQAHLCILL